VSLVAAIVTSHGFRLTHLISLSLNGVFCPTSFEQCSEQLIADLSLYEEAPPPVEPVPPPDFAAPESVFPPPLSFVPPSFAPDSFLADSL